MESGNSGSTGIIRTILVALVPIMAPPLPAQTPQSIPRHGRRHENRIISGAIYRSLLSRRSRSVIRRSLRITSAAFVAASRPASALCEKCRRPATGVTQWRGYNYLRDGDPAAQPTAGRTLRRPATHGRPAAEASPQPAADQALGRARSRRPGAQPTAIRNRHPGPQSAGERKPQRRSPAGPARSAATARMPAPTDRTRLQTRSGGTRTGTGP